MGLYGNLGEKGVLISLEYSGKKYNLAKVEKRGLDE